PASGGNANSLIILLHGHGSNGEDMIGLAQAVQSQFPDAAFVAPDGLQSMGGVARRWFPVTTASEDELAAGANAACPVVEAFIDTEGKRYGVGRERTVLVGFSQGAIVALHLAIKTQRPLAGMVGFSGMLAATSVANTTGPTTPITLIHGALDLVVPASAVTRAETTLKKAGFGVTTSVFDGLGHSIDQRSLGAGTNAIALALAATRYGTAEPFRSSAAR
ncbi:MAG TPA: alpha/beta fold hydrolase, partial [Devosiaceae bacterium]|nr:alpha/beta fold hydrolase [Devosiaceae bacterium]